MEQSSVVLDPRFVPAEVPLALTADLRGSDHLRTAGHSVPADDLVARTTADQPDRVTPRPGPGARLEDGRLPVLLRPASRNVLRLDPVPVARPPQTEPCSMTRSE